MTPGNDLPRLAKWGSEACQATCLSSRYSSQGDVLSYLGLFEYQKGWFWRLLTSSKRFTFYWRLSSFVKEFTLLFLETFFFSGRTRRRSCWKGENLPVANDHGGPGAEDGSWSGPEILSLSLSSDSVFLAVQDSSISDIVCLSVGLSQLTIRA